MEAGVVEYRRRGGNDCRRKRGRAGESAWAGTRNSRSASESDRVHKGD